MQGKAYPAPDALFILNQATLYRYKDHPLIKDIA